MKQRESANRLVRHKRAVILCAIAVVAYLIVALSHPLGWLKPETWETLKHALGALAVVLLVHVMDKFYFAVEFEKQLDEIKEKFEEARDIMLRNTRDQFDKMQTNLEQAHEVLINESASLHAMNISGMLKAYPSRDKAAADIFSDLVQPSVTEIRIIGISLNDFIGNAPNTALHEAWTRLMDFKANDNRSQLDIKVLIIDPDCFGARLREQAENRDLKLHAASRLKGDLESTTNAINELLGRAKDQGARTGLSFDCRFYRLPPQLFLCWTNQVCYVQPYHFWATRDSKTSIPMFKYRAIPEPADQAHVLHKEMRQHFDWIWQHASIGFDEHVLQILRGTDGGIIQTGATNCFTDSDLARDRMVALLNGNPKEVDIQGVSLHSFFEHDKILQTTLLSLFGKAGTTIRLLVIDPDGEQAKYRSYREFLLQPNSSKIYNKESFAQYCSINTPKDSDLFRHTNAAMRSFTAAIEKLNEDPTKSGSVEMRCYSSAPGCFIVRVDDTVLVEQYLYGKIERTHSAKKEILGKDMPLFEFKKDTSQKAKFYEDLGQRNPFNLVADHFTFAWRLAKRVAAFPANDTEITNKVSVPRPSSQSEGA